MKVKPKIEPMSNCCRAPMSVSSGEERTNFYVCSACHCACDPFQRLMTLSYQEPVKVPSLIERLKKKASELFY